jgi:putative membrane protein
MSMKRAFIVLTFLALLADAAPVLAHGGGEGGPEDLWQHWSFGDIPLLLLTGWLYARGVSSLWTRAGAGSGISRRQAAGFVAGLAVLFIALVSPLDFLSDELFSAHMVQHLLLMMVAAPLFVLGRFPLALSWAFSPDWTRRIWKQWRWKRAWKFLTIPTVAGLLHAAAIWIWHMPRLYDASLLNEGLHFLEHFCFFVSALIFWQVFADLSESVRLGTSARFGLALFFVFGTMIVTGFLGVLIAFSPHVWYSVYLRETALYGLTALEDQQLAGTIMWVPSGVIYLLSAMSVIGRWLFRMEAVEIHRLEG